MIIVNHILVKRTITVARIPAVADNVGKEVVFNNCAPFIDCISEINNMQIANAKDIDVVMAMYNLIVYGNNYSKKWGSLWQ